MQLEGTHTFKAPKEAVWETLMDPDALAKALPGGEKLEKVGENRYEATLNVRVGPVQGKFDGEVELSDIVELESYRMKISGQGTTGFVNGDADIKLEENDEGTLMTYIGEAQVGGRIASVGQRLIDSSAKSITRQGLTSLDRQIQARLSAEEEGEPVPEFTTPTTTQVAAAVAKDVTTDTMGSMMDKLMSPELQPYSLAGGAIIITLAIALISWLIAGGS